METKKNLTLTKETINSIKNYINDKLSGEPDGERFVVEVTQGDILVTVEGYKYTEYKCIPSNDRFYPDDWELDYCYYTIDDVYADSDVDDDIVWLYDEIENARELED